MKKFAAAEINKEGIEKNALGLVAFGKAMAAYAATKPPTTFAGMLGGLYDGDLWTVDNTYTGEHKDNILWFLTASLGGKIPFIFQPDSNNANTDGWAICKLDMKSFKFKQVANGSYNVKLKIREVW